MLLSCNNFGKLLKLRSQAILLTSLEEFNATRLHFIHTVKHPRYATNLLPITLCNVLAKLLANRLKPILLVIIDQSQVVLSLVGASLIIPLLSLKPSTS